ncbi:transport protein particle component [Peziza echinospora]|nr:transport protein particle component [Peziza echinospora]
MSTFDTPLPPFSSSDPHATFLSSTCLDLLLIELVPLAHRLAHDLSLPLSTTTTTTTTTSSNTSTSPPNPNPTSPPPPPSSTNLDDDELRESVFYRLELLGYRVGHGLAERFSRDRARMNDTLDVIKFCCKDLWTIVFRKQIDNLKTNHRGVYVLTDNTFRPFSRMSTEAGGGALVRAQPYLWFPCGVIRGALANMGVQASVQAETTELPGAIFKIETIGRVG